MEQGIMQGIASTFFDNTVNAIQVFVRKMCAFPCLPGSNHGRWCHWREDDDADVCFHLSGRPGRRSQEVVVDGLLQCLLAFEWPSGAAGVRGHSREPFKLPSSQANFPLCSSQKSIGQPGPG